MAIVAFFLLFFWALLSWFTGYFDEIIAGVDWLAGGKGENLVLPPELDFMAEKLGAVTDELERSAAAEREAERRKNDLVLYLSLIHISGGSTALSKRCAGDGASPPFLPAGGFFYSS